MNANQPAYPCVWYDVQPTTGEQVVREHFGGLTKREEFAKAAMQGFCSFSELLITDDAKIAEWSAKRADALLAELAKETKA